MKTDVLIPIVVIIGCIILIIIKSVSDEDFKGEKRESDIFLTAPIFISDLENKKDLIINRDDSYNNFPLGDIVIEPPSMSDGPIDKDAAFKDVNFIRDKGVENAMRKKIQTNDIDYDRAINGYLNFQNPKNSSDFLTDVNIRDIPKDELSNSTLADIFNKTTAKVINHVSEEQIKNITGKQIEENPLTGLYKPEVSLMDKNLELNNLGENITYKYTGYNELPLGSMI